MEVFGKISTNISKSNQRFFLRGIEGKRKRGAGKLFPHSALRMSLKRVIISSGVLQ